MSRYQDPQACLNSLISSIRARDQLPDYDENMNIHELYSRYGFTMQIILSDIRAGISVLTSYCNEELTRLFNRKDIEKHIKVHHLDKLSFEAALLNDYEQRMHILNK